MSNISEEGVITNSSNNIFIKISLFLSNNAKTLFCKIYLYTNMTK